MHAKEVRIIAVTALVVGMTACGGGTTMGTPQTPPPTTQSMQGSWIFLFHSDVSDGYASLEANLSQTNNHVFADKTSALVFHPITHGNSTLQIELERLGGKCDSGGVGDVTVDATISKGGPTPVSLTLSETGVLGSAITTASASTDGANISDGTYSTPTACGSPEDHGTFMGNKDSIAFSGETYSGTLNDGADVIVAQFGSTPNSSNLTVSGTDNSTHFSLSGSTVGFSLYLTGTIAGETVNWFGLYDPTYNNFFLYDSDSTSLGALQSGTNP